MNSTNSLCRWVFGSLIFALLSVSAFAADKIVVRKALYGANCKAKNPVVTPLVARECNGKQECIYTVDARRLGDRAPGCAKAFEVAYTCGHTTLKAGLPPEAHGKRLKLACAPSAAAPATAAASGPGAKPADCGKAAPNAKTACEVHNTALEFCKTKKPGDEYTRCMKANHLQNCSKAPPQSKDACVIHDTALAACKGKSGADYGKCMAYHHLADCSKAPPQSKAACENHNAAISACKGKQNPDFGKCMSEHLRKAPAGPVAAGSPASGSTPAGPGLNWIAVKDGKIPAKATIGGKLANGVLMPVCRADMGNGIHPGKVYNGKCYVGFGGKEVIKPVFEVLVTE